MVKVSQETPHVDGGCPLLFPYLLVHGREAARYTNETIEAASKSRHVASNLPCEKIQPR